MSGTNRTKQISKTVPFDPDEISGGLADASASSNLAGTRADSVQNIGFAGWDLGAYMEEAYGLSGGSAANHSTAIERSTKAQNEAEKKPKATSPFLALINFLSKPVKF
jgi:hypothetical protein